MVTRLASLFTLGFSVLFTPGCALNAAPITNVTVCGRSIAVSQILPPSGSGPVVLMAAPCLDSWMGGPLFPQAYRQYVELPPSRPAEGVWIPFDETAQKMMQDDYRRLWESGRLSDLDIVIIDYTFSNGVIGKFVTYTLKELTPVTK